MKEGIPKWSPVEIQVRQHEMRNKMRKGLRQALIAAGVTLAAASAVEGVREVAPYAEKMMQSRGEKLEAEVRRPSAITSMDDLMADVKTQEATLLNYSNTSVKQFTSEDIASVDAAVETLLKDPIFVSHDPYRIFNRYYEWSISSHATELLKQTALELVSEAGPSKVADVLTLAKHYLPQKDFADVLAHVSAATSTEIALLAFNQDVNPTLDPKGEPPLSYRITEDPSLTRVADIPDAAVTPIVLYRMRPQSLEADALSMFQGRFSRLNEGRAALMAHISQQDGYLDPIQIKQSVAMVARNIWMSGYEGELSADRISKEVEVIASRRIAVGPEKLFDKKIVLISHGEILEQNKNDTSTSETPRFGNENLIDALSIAQDESSPKEAAGIEHISPLTFDPGSQTYQMSAELLQRAHQAALDAVADGSSPSTIMFDGHGDDTVFGLSGLSVGPDGAQVDAKSNMITVDEMVDALEKRWHTQHSLHPHDTEINVSLIFSACQMQNYLRSIAAGLQERNIPMPRLMMSTSEYGQYSFSDSPATTGSFVNDYITRSRTIFDLIKNKETVTGSTPSIFVPRPDHKTLMQLGGIVVPLADTAIG